MNHNHIHDHSDHESKSDTPDGNLVLCPVMKDMSVDKEEAEKEGRVREYKGKKYYFCCDGCITDFEANPEKYAN